MGLARVILPLLLRSFGAEERTFFDCLTKVKNILRNRGKSRVNQKRRKKAEVEVEAQVSDDGLPCDRPSKGVFFAWSEFSVIKFAQSYALNLLKNKQDLNFFFVKLRKKYEKALVLQVLCSKVKILRRF